MVPAEEVIQPSDTEGLLKSGAEFCMFPDSCGNSIYPIKIRE